MNKELVTAEIVHRKDFVAALETVAKLAKQLVGKGWEVPPTHIANECNRWAQTYTQTIRYLEQSMEGKNGTV